MANQAHTTRRTQQTNSWGRNNHLLEQEGAVTGDVQPNTEAQGEISLAQDQATPSSEAGKTAQRLDLSQRAGEISPQTIFDTQNQRMTTDHFDDGQNIEGGASSNNPPLVDNISALSKILGETNNQKASGQDPYARGASDTYGHLDTTVSAQDRDSLQQHINENPYSKEAHPVGADAAATEARQQAAVQAAREQVRQAQAAEAAKQDQVKIAETEAAIQQLTNQSQKKIKEMPTARARAVEPGLPGLNPDDVRKTPGTFRNVWDRLTGILGKAKAYFNFVVKDWKQVKSSENWAKKHQAKKAKKPKKGAVGVGRRGNESAQATEAREVHDTFHHERATDAAGA